MEFKEFFDKYLKDDKEEPCAERLKLIEKVWDVCKTIHQYNRSERSVQPMVRPKNFISKRNFLNIMGNLFPIEEGCVDELKPLYESICATIEYLYKKADLA